MSKLTSLIRRAPKRFAVIATLIAAAIIVPLTANAWGPSRATFTYENPADYVTFNSITNNPTVGDERNFVRIREAGTGTFTDSAALQAGKTYEVSMYYHNNAKTSLNASGAGVAKDATARVQMPGVLQANEAATITGFVNASNANPTSVWDEAKGTNGSDAVALRYVPSSAKFTSNGAINGQTVPDTLFTTGAKLGFDAQDGKLPGCNEFAGYITFKFTVDKPNFTVEKQVSTDGKTWTQEVTSAPGSTVEYRLIYKNTGTTQQDGVVLRDYLPAGVTYVAGSTQIANSKTGGTYQATVDGVTAGGYNIGSYAPNGNAYLKFKAKIAESNDKYVCGINTLKNVARATTSGGYKEDDALVKFDKKCVEPKDIQVCELSTKKVITIKEADFDATKHSKNLDDCKEVVKYVKVCELETKKIVTIKEADFDATKHSKNLDDCKEAEQIKVCELATKNVITIDEADYDTTKHSKNLDDCKVVVKDITVCELKTKEIVTIHEADFDETKYSKNLDDCKETPEVPEVLPETGITENIVAILGLGALVASVAYYIASRRALV